MFGRTEGDQALMKYNRKGRTKAERWIKLESYFKEHLFLLREIILKGRKQCRGEIDIEERKGIINGENLFVTIKIMIIIMY